MVKVIQRLWPTPSDPADIPNRETDQASSRGRLACFRAKDAPDMNDRLHPDMLEATKPARTDSLIETTALPQSMRRSAPDTPSGILDETVNMPAGWGSRIIDVLSSAVAFLQRMFRSTPGTLGDTADAPEGGGSRINDVAPATIAVIDLQPAACPEPEFGADGSRQPAGAMDGLVQPHQPTPQHSFLERVNRTGSDPDTGDLAKPSSTPDAVPGSGQFLERSYSNQAGSRAYKLYIPSGYHEQTLPLVVMLHGSTQSPDDFAAGTRMNALAEEHTCLIAYPAQTVCANALKSWNWFRPSDQQRDQGEPSLIAGLTRQIMRDHPVDPRRVYVAGLSAGAAAAAILGETYPDLYAAIGVHSGLARGAASGLVSAFAAMRHGGPATGRRSDSASGDREDRRIVPTIVFHGDQDTTVHPRNGDQVIARSRATTILALETRVEHGQVPDGHPYSRTRHADPSGQAVFEQWVIHGANHAWSGGSPTGSYTDPRGPDATREMLRFFFEHPHSTAVGCAQ
jgi:poly(hydroxyalkanoate) depolymerase family esterase